MTAVDPNILSEFETWLYQAVFNHSNGEQVRFAAGLVVVPTPQGPAPALGVTLTLPGLVLGEVAQSFTLLPLVGHTYEAVDNWVFETIQGLLNERSREAGSPVTNNGSSGLIVPT